MLVATMGDLPELRDAMSLVWRILLLWLAVLALFVSLAGWAERTSRHGARRPTPAHTSCWQQDDRRDSPPTSNVAELRARAAGSSRPCK